MMHNLNSDCGTCTDFQDWMKQSKSQTDTKTSNAEAVIESSKPADSSYYSECPLFRNQLGKSTWNYLHTMAAYYPPRPTEQEQTKMKDFIETFAHFFPCKHCATDFQDECEFYVIFEFFK